MPTLSIMEDFKRSMVEKEQNRRAHVGKRGGGPPKQGILEGGDHLGGREALEHYN